MPLDESERYPVQSVERIRIGPAVVPALLVRPQTAQPCPAVLLQHGYGASKADLLPLATMLAGAGIIALLPDAWGHGERFPASGPNWRTEMSPDFFLSTVQHTVDDARAALDALYELPGVRPDAVIVGGFSLGAMVALILGTEDSRLAGVVSVSGSSLPDLLPARLFGDALPSETAMAWAREHDATAHIAALAPKPLLLQHGRVDDLVPVAGAMRLYGAALLYYAAASNNLALLLYDHGHTVSEREIEDGVAWLAERFSEPVSPP